jgi:hypothetical protein
MIANLLEGKIRPDSSFNYILTGRISRRSDLDTIAVDPERDHFIDEQTFSAAKQGSKFQLITH